MKLHGKSSDFAFTATAFQSNENLYMLGISESSAFNRSTRTGWIPFETWEDEFKQLLGAEATKQIVGMRRGKRVTFTAYLSVKPPEFEQTVNGTELKRYDLSDVDLIGVEF